MSATAGGSARWADAALAAALFACAPHELGGVALRALPGPVRQHWLDLLGELLFPELPRRRVPAHVTEAGLLGGLDLAATLRSGRPVAEPGLLAGCDGGVVTLAMAERAERSTVAHLCAALDQGELTLAREGVSERQQARLGVIALDEGLDESEALHPALQDRLAFHLDLSPLAIRDIDVVPWDRDVIAEARGARHAVQADDAQLRALCSTALVLGVASPRAPLLALRAARCAAALDGRSALSEADLEAAARLVLAPRATCLPPAPEEEQEQEAPPEEPPPETPPQDSENPEQQESDPQQPLEDRVLEAAAAAVPPALLALLEAGRQRAVRAQQPNSGRSRLQQRSSRRGRPMGAAPGDPRRGARLSLVATLRAAAPWQPVRRREARAGTAGVLVERDDFRITRYRQRRESTIVFIVDASGSAALHRLAEAKGAVELLLNDCYVRRDQVALIAFRGERAELLLPPTRSLVRAKRNLAALPGGGPTPLSSALDAALALVEQLQRQGGSPALVFLTDARANIARDGSRGRETAFDEALAVAKALRIAEVRSLVIDTSPRPHRNGEALAAALGGRYLPLPHADARVVRAGVESGLGL